MSNRDSLWWYFWPLPVLLIVAVVYVYRIGYADGARQAAPLAAPPTNAERAR